MQQTLTKSLKKDKKWRLLLVKILPNKQKQPYHWFMRILVFLIYVFPCTNTEELGNHMEIIPCNIYSFILSRTEVQQSVKNLKSIIVIPVVKLNLYLSCTSIEQQPSL